MAFLLAGFGAQAQDAATADDPVLTRKVNALRAVWQDVEANAVGSEKREQYLREFLEKSAPVLEGLPANHSMVPGFWTLRAVAACELNEPRIAWEAGQKMISLGLDKSQNELVQRTLALLERKGWLDADFGNKLKVDDERQKAKQAEQKELDDRFKPLVGNYTGWSSITLVSKSDKSKMAIASGTITIKKLDSGVYHISGAVSLTGNPFDQIADCWIRYELDSDLEAASKKDLSKYFDADFRAKVVTSAFAKCNGNTRNNINSGRPYTVQKVLFLKTKEGRIFMNGVKSRDFQNPIIEGMALSIAGLRCCD